LATDRQSRPHGTIASENNAYVNGHRVKSTRRRAERPIWDEAMPAIRKRTVTVIDDHRGDQSDQIQLSNVSFLENCETREVASSILDPAASIRIVPDRSGLRRCHVLDGLPERILDIQPVRPGIKVLRVRDPLDREDVLDVRKVFRTACNQLVEHQIGG
jgi:hypothetical protein